MICLFCGDFEAPVVEKFSLSTEEAGTIHQVLVMNQPICDDCRVNIGERAATNDRIRRTKD